MADDVRITADDFLKVSKALKAAGKTEMRKELNKSLKRAARPLIPKTRAAALRLLPKKNGLNKIVARSPQRVAVKTGQKNAGVQIVVGNRKGGAARGANKGVIRHPVFGREDNSGKRIFVPQEVPGGWFDDTLKREAPGVKPAVEDAVRATIDRIVRDGS